jgi:hypothetical protein
MPHSHTPAASRYWLLVCLAAVVAVSGLHAAHAADPAKFPLVLRGKTLVISTAADRASLAAQLKDALPGEEPAKFDTGEGPDEFNIRERIQYDFIDVKGEAPVMLLVDFDAKGRWSAITIESMMKVQNPAAQKLLAWLAQNAGRGRKSGKDTVWNHGGMTFRFNEVRDAGDDSNYGITITRN